MFKINLFKTVFRAFVVLSIGYLACVDSHGMMLEPPNRASMWRFDPSAPSNYDDNALYCGGYHEHYMTNGGKCGLCGDNYSDPKPRAHENGGIYGNGVITRKYTAGQKVDISVKITQNHKGHFQFQLCCDISVSPESEECFETLKTENGKDVYVLPSEENGFFNTTVMLPEDVIGNHCVLRWIYTAANSWGVCEDGNGALGCGSQETFVNCADVSVSPSESSRFARK